MDLDPANRAQFALLEKVFGVHPLAIEEAVNPAARPKIEDYGDFLFLVVRGLSFRDIYDPVMRINESLAAYRELPSSTMRWRRLL